MSAADTVPAFVKVAPLFTVTLLWVMVLLAALLETPVSTRLPSPLTVPVFVSAPVTVPLLASVPALLTADSTSPSFVNVIPLFMVMVLCVMLLPEAFEESPVSTMEPSAPLIVPLLVSVPVIRPALAIADSFFILSAVTLPLSLIVRVPASTVTSVASTAPLFSKSPLNDTLL